MKALLSFLILLLVFWISFCSFYWYPCKIQNLCDDKSTTQVEKPTIKPTPAEEVSVTLRNRDFTINHGQELNLKAASGINFQKSKTQAIIADESNQLLNQLADFAKINPNKQILINGLYDNTKESGTAADDLGKNRAEAIRQWLINKGVSDHQLAVSGKSINTLELSNDTAYNAITIKLATIEEPESKNEKPAAAKPKSLPDTRVLTFAEGSTSLQSGESLSEYIYNVKQFLKANPTKKLILVGHTDNLGSSESNHTLGIRRAKKVRTSFINAGVPYSQITVKSEGESRPIQSNDTEAGKKANRRVEISIQ